MFAFVSAGIPLPGPAVPNVTPVVESASATARPSGPGDPQLVDPTDLYVRYRDADAGIAIVPPRGWAIAPAASLDRAGDEQAYEVARFQLRIGDAALYAQPVPVTKGLLADAQAILSVALAREGSDLEDVDLSAVPPDGVDHVPGATALDSETSYEGVTTFTRILVARDTQRTAVIRAYVPSADRDAFAARILAAIRSATIDPDGPSGPRYVAPAPPAPPEPDPADAAAVAPVDPTAQARADIIARAAEMLGTPYVWGGNSPGRGMDCSAYVSAAWGVGRYTTDSIWNVAVAVAKGDLLPGDAMDLETWRDGNGYGHIRLFEAWANEAHTLVWVYEETPPRAIHRVIAYDASYRPMRLSGLSGGGVAPLVPAPAAQPIPRLQPASSGSRPATTRTPSATRRPSTYTPRPTATPQRRTATPRPKATPRPTATSRSTATATVLPTATSRTTVTAAPPPPTPRPAAIPTRSPQPTVRRRERESRR